MSDKLDLIICGGGVIGLSAAYFALQKGWEVGIIDSHILGQGASRVASGILPPPIGKEFFSSFREALHDSVQDYPVWLKEIQRELGKEIPFWEGGMHFFFGRNGKDKFWSQIQQLEREKSQDGFEIFHKKDLELQFGIPNMEGAIFFPSEKVVDTGALLDGLIKICRKRGAKIGEQVFLQSIHSNPNEISLDTNQGVWRASFLLVTGGVWSNHILQFLNIELPLIPVKGEILWLEGHNPSKKILHWNREYHFVPRRNYSLFGATSRKGEWETKVDQRGVKKLQQKLDELWNIHPSWFQEEKKEKGKIKERKPPKISRSLAGIRPRTKDWKPIIGKLEDGVYVSTGHYKSGIALAPFSAKAILELIEMGKTSYPLEEFSPWRKKGGKKIHNP